MCAYLTSKGHELSFFILLQHPYSDLQTFYPFSAFFGLSLFNNSSETFSPIICVNTLSPLLFSNFTIAWRKVDFQRVFFFLQCVYRTFSFCIRTGEKRTPGIIFFSRIYFIMSVLFVRVIRKVITCWCYTKLK